MWVVYLLIGNHGRWYSGGSKGGLFGKISADDVIKTKSLTLVWRGFQRGLAPFERKYLKQSIRGNPYGQSTARVENPHRAVAL